MPEVNAINVVLVDGQGREVGMLEKAAAHRNPGFLHKAISVVLWRESQDGSGQKEVLLQKRSQKKPLWPGFWADTCSTHQLPGESDLDCAVRRLHDELGIQISPSQLRVLYTYQYQANFSDELSEHELNHVIVGEWDGELTINKDEVEAVKWMKWKELVDEVQTNPSHYADWFVLMVRDERLLNYFKE